MTSRHLHLTYNGMSANAERCYRWFSAVNRHRPPRPPRAALREETRGRAYLDRRISGLVLCDALKVTLEFYLHQELKS